MNSHHVTLTLTLTLTLTIIFVTNKLYMDYPDVSCNRSVDLGLLLGGLPIYYPRRARSAIGVDTVFTLDVFLYVCMLAL